MRKIFDNKTYQRLMLVLRLFVIIVLACYVSFVIVQRITGNKSIMGYRFFTVATGSMKGVYDINDVIAVRDCDPKVLEVGDDIAYMGTRDGFEGKIIVHRIICLEEAADGSLLFTTKGVNSNMEDPIIKDNQVMGIVEGKIPIITEINHIVRSQLGFFTLVFCPLVLIIVLEILQTITDYQVDNNEIQKIKRAK